MQTLEGEIKKNKKLKEEADRKVASANSANEAKQRAKQAAEQGYREVKIGSLL